MRQIKLDQVRHRKIVDSCRRMGHMLQNSLRSDGRKRFVESAKSVAEANSGKLVHKTKNRENQNQKEVVADSVFGHDIEELSSTNEALYNIHFPFRRGTAFVNDRVRVYSVQRAKVGVGVLKFHLHKICLILMHL